MPDTKVSALTAATAAADANEYPINEAGTSKKVTGTLIKDWIGDTIGNASTAAQTPTAATLTYLTNSNMAVPVAKLRIGTQFLWWLFFDKTAAGTLASSFHVRVGTAGTTADTARLTFTTGAGTAAIDQGFLQILVTCRGPLSASGIFEGVMTLTHNLQTTGVLAVQQQVAFVTSGAFDVTTANLIVGLSVTTGTAQAWTFRQIRAEAKQL